MTARAASKLRLLPFCSAQVSRSANVQVTACHTQAGPAGCSSARPAQAERQSSLLKRVVEVVVEEVGEAQGLARSMCAPSARPPGRAATPSAAAKLLVCVGRLLAALRDC